MVAAFECKKCITHGPQENFPVRACSLVSPACFSVPAIADSITQQHPSNYYTNIIKFNTTVTVESSCTLPNRLPMHPIPSQSILNVINVTNWRITVSSVIALRRCYAHRRGCVAAANQVRDPEPWPRFLLAGCTQRWVTCLAVGYL